MFEQATGELRATLLGNHSGISNERTHRLERARRSGGPGCSADTRQQESPQPNFARNLTRSFFEIGHKRCNSNNVNSMFEQATGELRATLLGNHPDQRGGRTHRQAAPVTSRCTRTEGVQCLQIGCNAYTSGARPPVTSSHADLPEWRSTDPTGLAAPGSGAAPTTNSARRRRSPNSWLGPRAAGPDGPSRRRAERAARDADNERATERAARVAPAA